MTVIKDNCNTDTVCFDVKTKLKIKNRNFLVGSIAMTKDKHSPHLRDSLYIMPTLLIPENNNITCA